MITKSYLKRKPKVTPVTVDAITPPMASRSRNSSISSFDDEAYFSKTYVPLSSLPTPPLSSHSNHPLLQSLESFGPEEVLDPDLLGPAIHLTNLIPSSTSLTTASVPLVHAILTRADLPLETIALAVCILDSLNSRFALQWRKNCPLVTKLVPSSFWAEPLRIEGQHIDSIHPELIVLSALILAVKFLDDAQQSTREYADDWGRGLWTCDQINYTQRTLLDNLGYRILPLWEENIILEALEDMEKAGKQAVTVQDSKEWESNTCLGTFRGANMVNTKVLSSGKAEFGLGHQITPVETPVEVPMTEKIRGTTDVSKETRTAFEIGSPDRSDKLQLPDRTLMKKEPFPVYEETLLNPFTPALGFS